MHKVKPISKLKVFMFAKASPPPGLPRHSTFLPTALQVLLAWGAESRGWGVAVVLILLTMAPGPGQINKSFWASFSSLLK